MTAIKKAAVVGAGTMGSGIASHLANAGVPVVLLDIVPQGADNRNVITEGAIQRLLDSSPPAFMHKSNVELITVGNIEDHMNLLADVDWIAEAVVERVEIKRALYTAIDRVRKAGAFVSSNTSTIPLAMLTSEMSEELKQDFCITHFFNPVRYMRLLEIVAGPQTRPEVIKELSGFCEVALGKGIVPCRDTPGFLGNRVGVYALQVGMTEAFTAGLTVEEADALMGRPMGIPKTGVFGLYDLIGIDLMVDVA
ncbi:MAG TPA: 3-hydroxyacyl-CoA dehydrogenase family protein, partial [Gammaproteobacteria bacterium]